MKKSEYWAKRFEALDSAAYSSAEKYARNVIDSFDRASRQVAKELSYWYGRLADNNEVLYADAKKLLNAGELKEFRWTLEEYVQHARDDGLDPQYVKMLENASAKRHISRLESMQIQIQEQVERLYKGYEGGVSDHLRSIAQDSYYHTAYELAKGTGVGVGLHRLDMAAIERFLSRPWCQDGKVFSDRIWTNKDALLRSLNTELTQGLITGRDPAKAIDAIAKEFAVDRSKASRLIMTETAAIQNEARRQCLNDLDVEEYEIVATLDSRTSEICRSMDGQHFRLSEFKAGLTAPPFHCNCRSCTVPYFDDEFTIGDTRAARDEDGKTYQVPSDLKYEDWNDAFVKGKKNGVEKYNTKLYNSKRRGQLPPAMSEERFNKMKKAHERQGTHIVSATGDEKKFLNALGAEATIIGDNEILYSGDIPSASAFFEETIHLTQAKKYGVLDSSDTTELYIREILANRKLLRNQKAYGFTQEDIEDVAENLKIWESKFLRKEGVSFDESGINRDI